MLVVTSEDTTYRSNEFLLQPELMLTYPSTLWPPRQSDSRSQPQVVRSGSRGKLTAKREYVPGDTGFQCLPLSNFKYFLTLFSKFFSSFPRGTCLLSVSRRYLALEEIYLPLEQHSQAIRLKEQPSYASVPGSETGFSPSVMLCSKRLVSRPSADKLLLAHNSNMPLSTTIFRLSYSRFTRRY